MPLPINDGTRLARRSEHLRQSYYVRTVSRSIRPNLIITRVIVEHPAVGVVNSMQNDC